MTTTKNFRNTLFILIALLNIGCDQVTKNIARTHLNESQEISLFTPHFTLTKTENSGAFLSLGQHLPLPAKWILLNIFPLLLLIYGVYFLFTRTRATPILILALGCIIGGGLGNLYDRILFGSVTDFMHIDLGFFQTGIFNMADVSVMVGMGLLLMHLYGTKQPHDFKLN